MRASRILRDCGSYLLLFFLDLGLDVVLGRLHLALGLHTVLLLAQDAPHGVQDTREPKEDAQDNVEPKVAVETVTMQKDGQGWEEDGHNDQDARRDAIVVSRVDHGEDE